MNLLFRIVYAAHANGTHHKLALDALKHLKAKDAALWQRLFLSEVEVYLEGSKAPDKEFKDFKNHVLHVGDDYWGGAPEKVESWYGKLVEKLRAGAWHEAVWAAGIMSHYLTDPIHPFHTAQSKAENNIHRAVEWSISKAYDQLVKQPRVPTEPAEAPGTGDNWIKDHVIAGAERANAHYETLIAHYDFHAGVVDPPAGLDEVCQTVIAGLLHDAADAHAQLLDRAFAEADVTPPDVALTAKTVVAGLKIPVRWVVRKMEDVGDRRQVEAMYDEWQATGRVEETLPEDDRQVRELYRREVETHLANHRDEARQRRRRHSPLPQGQVPPLASAGGRRPADPAAQRPLSSRQTCPSADVSTTSVPRTGGASFKGPAGEPLARLRDRLRNAAPGEAAQAAAGATKDAPANTATARDERRPRLYLTASDDLEAAPSIGPKTAARFAAIDILTVEQFLVGDPDAMAEALDTRYITAKVLVEWQQQAKLVCTVPGLRGGHAQLLVGAGLTDVEALRDADAGEALAAILRFAQTSEGERILRDGQPPDLEKVHAWVTNAQSVERAA